MKQKLVLGISIIFAGFIGLLLDFFKINTQLIMSITAGIPVIISALYEFYVFKKKSRRERINQILVQDIYMNPVLASIYFILTLQFIMRALGAFFGWIFGWVIGSIEEISGLRLSEYHFLTVFLPALSTFTHVLQLPVILGLSVIYAHRINKNSFFWISISILIHHLITFLVVILFKNYPENYFERYFTSSLALTINFLYLIALFACGALGCWWAKRTHSTYIMTRLFRQLTNSDQKELIELVKTLPAYKKGRDL